MEVQKLKRSLKVLGRKGKSKLDEDKMEQVRQLTFKYFPVSPPGDKDLEDKEWQATVCEAIHKGLRGGTK